MDDRPPDAVSGGPGDPGQQNSSGGASSDAEPAGPGNETTDRWTSTVVLGDGSTAVIRPISPADAGALAAFHDRQSPDSRYLRYFSPKPTLTAKELEHFTVVDFVDRAAFVVEEHGEFIAWASYERLKNRVDAEVAFQVDDRYHGKGVATLLLEHLAAVARHNDIEHFTAQTLGTNRGMLAVFAKAGWPVHRRFESGVIDIDFPLAETSEFIDSVERREQRADSRAVARLLLPSSIAVVGASDEPGSVGRYLWEHVSAGARQPVYPVNPHHATIGGTPAFASVADVPGEVGLALIAVPASQLHAVVDDCIAKRVRGAVVVTVADPAADGIAALIAHARRHGLRIIGPASMGIASPRAETALQAALVPVDLPPGNVAFSLQSGTLGSSLLRLAHRLQLGVSWFVSLGDKSDVSANDLLQFWEDDDATGVIALYTESLGNPRKFARIARRVSASRPIIAVRTGAALIGIANDALYRETGVIQVPTVAAMLDTARVLATQPLMAGRRVAVLSNAQSPRVLAEATLAAAGLDHTPLVDQLSWSSRGDDYGEALRSALASDEVDAVVVVHAPPVMDAVGEPVEAIEAACAGATKPVVAVMLGSGDGPIRPGSAIPAFAFPEQAVAVLGRVAAYSAWRADAADAHPEPARVDIDAARAGALIADHLEVGTMTVDRIRELLAAYGVTMPPTECVPATGAVAAADRIGYPVAVKASRRRIGRSVEAGVALDLVDGADVAAAVATMTDHLGDGAAIVLVQEMVSPGVDFRVRVSVDDRIGPVVTVGLGGLHADVIADESSRLAPVPPAVARAMVDATRAASAVGRRELDAVADVVVRVAQLASDHREIAELDLNPVIVGREGCLVTDATIRLAPPSSPEWPTRRLEGD